MNRELAIKVADTVLYEGYMLYPYRRSAIKNQQRWSFGILYPPAYEEVQSGTERSVMHSECLIEFKGAAKLGLELRFLQLVSNQVLFGKQRDSEPTAQQASENSEEGIERSVELTLLIPSAWHTVPFTFPAGVESERVANSNRIASTVKRVRRELMGVITLACEQVMDGVTKLTIDVVNETRCAQGIPNRDSALQQSLLSAHTILSLAGGEFISLLDPPSGLRDAVSRCKNVGNFPVLVGEEGDRDMMLCSPIVLYDYPQIAPESAGDFYDSTEMDEMLTLRVMTLTDEEKTEMRNSDDRARDLLQRTEETAREQLIRTHGTIRGPRPNTPPRKDTA